MKRDCTVLFSSAGRRVELMRCFRDDAAALGIDLKVLAADMCPPWSAACRDADACFELTRCSSPAFLENLLAICRRWSVDLLIPTIDPELDELSRHVEDFSALGTDVVVGSPGLVGLARDKLATADFLAGHGIPVPRTAALEEVAGAPGAWNWPLLLKPRGGSSSVGIMRIEAPADLPEPDTLPGYVAQELLGGEEYTVNMFFDRAGALRCVIPHRRHEIRAGEVAKGVTVRQPVLEEIGWSLGTILAGARGALCYQAIVDPHGRAAVFEINARFGGGYPLAHQAGACFSRWLLEEAAGLEPSCHNDWRNGVTMLRYDAALYR